MVRYRFLLGIFALSCAFSAMVSLPAAAQGAQPWTQVGSLMCKVNPNVGFVIFGHQPMECTYTPTLRGGAAAILRWRYQHGGP